MKILGVMVVVPCETCVGPGGTPCTEQLYHTELLRYMACVMPAGHEGPHSARCQQNVWCSSGQRVQQVTVSEVMDALNEEALTRAIVRASGPVPGGST